MMFNKKAIKCVAATLVLGQLNMGLQPLYAATLNDKGASSPMLRSQIERMQALQRDIDAAKVRKAQENLSPADQASQRLARVEELVRDFAFLGEQPQAVVNAKQQGQDQVRAIGPNLKARLKPLTAEQKAQRHDRRQQLMAELMGLLSQQVQDQAAVRSEFAQTRQTLLDRKLPAEILVRHDEAVAKFELRVAQFNQFASKAQQGDEQALTELQSFFDQNPTKRKAAPLDPKNLPWRTPEPTKRLPAETQTAWFQNLYGNKGTRLAQVGNSLEGLEFVTPPEPAVAPTAADLAETPETQRTAAIKAKALELGNNPVNIQNWVRNNVEWVPTWGAIQSAQDTLDNRRGNAIDIASLEIALLRAAKIPARYQFGTIELPAEQVMNWVGGVTKPEAAQQLLGQGGIANRGLVEGGRISKIRMEHAWVQAYVNWLPSRGAKQGSATQHPSPLAQRNAWVPLDPSFKQYEFAPVVDITRDVPLDLNALRRELEKGANINDALGSVQGLNIGGLEQSLEKHAVQLSAYLRMNHPGATVDSIKGKKIIPVAIAQMLAGAPSFSVASMGAMVAEVPQPLVHSITIRLYSNSLGEYGDSLFSYTLPLHRLGSKRLGVTYLPATSADQAVIADYKARGQIGLPAYSLRMKGVLKLDDEQLAELPVFGMGAGQYWAAQIYGPGSGSREFDFKAVGAVGDEIVFGLDLYGVDQAQIARRKALFPRQTAAENLHHVALMYWALQDASHETLARHMGVHQIRMPSIGMFAQPLKVTYSWGVPRSSNYAGRFMDVRLSEVAVAAPQGLTQVRPYMHAIGELDSFYEGATFDLLFGHELTSGASAITVLNDAMRQKQTIFHITSRNYDSVQAGLGALPSNVRQQIDAAIFEDKEVIVSGAPVQHGNWNGVGLIVRDADTGAGAYLISGGINGGEEDTCSNDRTNEPTSIELPDLGLLGKLFFVLMLLALAAWIIGTGGLGGAALAFIGSIFVAQTAAAQAVNNVPVVKPNSNGFWGWNSSFAKTYGAWPSAAASGYSLPDVCPATTKAYLEAEKDGACSQVEACSRATSFCPDIQDRINKRLRCIGARLKVMEYCYPGGAAGFGDEPHWEQVRNHVNGLGQCLCEAGRNGCQPILDTP